MKVDIYIPEEIAIQLWLDGNDLTDEVENFLEFIPKTSHKSYSQKTKYRYKDSFSYHGGETQVFTEFNIPEHKTRFHKRYSTLCNSGAGCDYCLRGIFRKIPYDGNNCNKVEPKTFPSWARVMVAQEAFDYLMNR